jgi:hypothetical protein
LLVAYWSGVSDGWRILEKKNIAKKKVENLEMVLKDTITRGDRRLPEPMFTGRF